ncbi:MAG: hypothetical protein ABJC33_01035 [Betaproteobacteria bacterium]
MITTVRLLAAVIVAALVPAIAAGQSPGMATGGVLTNPGGMTLYTFDKDAGDKSACNGPCVGLWPPLTAAANAKPSGDWKVITRDDGARQWAYKGKPVYMWSKDTKPGDKSGDGINNVWHAAKP